MSALPVAFIVFDNFQSMSLAAQSVFEYANVCAERNLYEMVVLSERGGVVRSSGGLSVVTEPFDDRLVDTVIMGSGDDLIETVPMNVVEFLKRSAPKTRRTASICSGAFALASASLLDGRRATTHWNYARQLQARYPRIKVDEDRIFVIDGSIWTSAGMTAGIDLALAMVEMDLGREIARRVAQKLVVYHWRSGGQSQHSTLLELAPKSDRIQAALAYARRNLTSALPVEQLADTAHLSPRQFSRVFRAETGQSPAKAIEKLRLEAARILLEDGRHTVGEIAAQTGFNDGRRMREAFSRAFGQSPGMLRRRGGSESA